MDMSQTNERRAEIKPPLPNKGHSHSIVIRNSRNRMTNERQHGDSNPGL